MKRLIIIMIIAMAAVAGFDYFSRHGQGRFDAALNKISNTINETAALEPKKEVSTPGALRSKEQSQGAFLTRAGTIQQTNVQRGQQGLQPLKENEKLNQAALVKVKDMFAGQYFEHISPMGKGPSDLAKDAGYDYIAVGENLALGNFANDEKLVQAWMNSPGHRANILNSKYAEIGVAVMQAMFEGRTTWLAVQEFGRPATDCPQVEAFLKDQINAGQEELKRLEVQIKTAKADLLKQAEPQSRQEAASYNQEVSEYNNLVKVFNNRVDTQKILLNKYNDQVRAFNQCAGK